MLCIQQPTAFIADIHLQPQSADRLQLLQQLLHHLVQQQCQHIYILGDMFDAWLGDDAIHPAFLPLLQQLQQLQQQHIAVTLAHGNRDFLLGSGIASSYGVTIMTEPTVVSLYGKRTLLLHGDELCSDDTSYQQLRTTLRDPNWIAQFLAKPISERIAIAQSIRAGSEQQKQQKSADIMDVNRNTVLQFIQQYAVSQIIHGHTHRPGVEQITTTGNSIVQRYVVDQWYDNQGDYLFADANGIEARPYTADLSANPL